MKFTLFGLISIFILLNSCSHRTEFGRKRLLKISRHNAPIDPKVFTLIDTASAYEYIHKFTLENPEPKYRYLNSYLKFYGNGRLGNFHIYDIKESMTDVSQLNPKRADIGYYKYDTQVFEIKTLFEHPQGGGFIKHTLVKSKNDTLIFVWNGDHRDTSYYKKVIIPKTALIYSPDW